MTNNKPANRIAKYLGNGHSTSTTCCRPQHEDYVGKIALVEPPIDTFGAGEYIIVDQTANALYGVKLGSAFDGSEVKLIPLIGPSAWTIVRVEPDTTGLTESTILMLSEFAATPPEDRHEDLDDCIYEGADYAAGALLRMLQRRQVDRCQALVRELERIEREATARFNCQQVQEAETATQVNGSGPDDSKPTADGYAPIPVLIVDLNTLDAVLGWLH